MPARPGYESARTGVQQPLLDKASCLAGCSGSRAVLVPDPSRVGRQVAGSGTCLAPLPPCRSAPGHSKTPAWHVFRSPLARPCPRRAAQRRPAGAMRNLDLTSWRGAVPARLSPCAPGHERVPPGQPEHSSWESLSSPGYLKAHLCPLFPLVFRLEEPHTLSDSEGRFQAGAMSLGETVGEVRDVSAPCPAAEY